MKRSLKHEHRYNTPLPTFGITEYALQCVICDKRTVTNSVKPLIRRYGKKK